MLIRGGFNNLFLQLVGFDYTRLMTNALSQSFCLPWLIPIPQLKLSEFKYY